MLHDCAERLAVRAMRRFNPGYLRQVPDRDTWLRELRDAASADAALDLLAAAEVDRVRDWAPT